MIDRETGESTPLGGLPGSDAGETFGEHPIGEYLRRQRLLRGMTTEELASLTRIPLRSLERLENGQFDGDTDGFVRGFVRTVASALGLDADDAIARMLEEPAAGSWERGAPSRSVQQGFVGLVLIVAAILFFLVLRAGWNVLRGVTSEPAAREVVLWQDPVRSLAEATGAQLDPAGEIAPMLREAAVAETDAVSAQVRADAAR